MYLFTLYTIRVRHSAAACTRLDKYMILTSSSSPPCDCVQSITVEKVDAFLELKIFKNNCSTMLRKHFQPNSNCHTLLLVKDFLTCSLAQTVWIWLKKSLREDYLLRFLYFFIFFNQQSVITLYVYICINICV